MQYRSFWQQEVKLDAFEEMKESTSCDVLIVGGGLCGLLTALELTERGVDGKRIVILDAERIGSGTSALATAKLTAQHGLIYARLEKELGRERAAQYAHANVRGIARALELSQRLHIPCVQKLPSYVYALSQKQRFALEKERTIALELGFSAELTEPQELPFPVNAALRFNGQAAIQPVVYMKALSDELIRRGCVIHEHTKALYPQKDAVVTDKGKVYTKTVVVSTRFPFADKRGLYYLKLRQQRSYLLMVDGAKRLNGCYIGSDRSGLSFRPYGDKLVVCGTLDEKGAPYRGFIDLIGRVIDLYPEAVVISKWSAEDCVTFDGIPYIGKYEGLPIETYLATGFNKWGMSTSFAAAQILAEQITRGYAEDQEVFAPSRTLVLKSWKNVFVHSAEVAMDYFGGLTRTLKRKDTPVPLCSHMGCPLHWNEAEQVWDCPCHGSRFDAGGRVLSGPAQKSIGDADGVDTTGEHFSSKPHEHLDKHKQ